ncbi:Uncharacterized protein OBRU01_16391 [Operophtera brumata]|uniref:FP protein C-terminal domain-containing protein n=1 Tax=Operophtera brumata TaxID=104452 RepID=A0A0L7KUP7_OPEBR|nr:Uncharacterized protein OBRU01_16391 [Operophtera brumata]
MSKILICAAGCCDELDETSCLFCCLCTDYYHHTCMNLSDEQFLGVSKEFKDSWVCPSCRSCEPKRGDNSNTPVRSVVAPTGPRHSSTRAAPPHVAPGRVVPPAPLARAAPAPARAGGTDHEYDNVTLRSKPRSARNCHCLSADIIREIIREELDRKLNSEIKDIQSKLSSIDESLACYSVEFDLLKRESEAQKQLIGTLQKDNAELRDTSRVLTNRVHQMELLSRADNLEIQCVPENKNENLYNTVQQLGKTIKCPLSDSDVQYCSRIAKLNNSSPRPRSILVKFNSRRLRDTFLAGVIKFNKYNSSDKLNTTHLGLCIKSLHAATRLKAKQLNYKFVWVRDGKVFVRKTENSNYLYIRNFDVLSSLS